MKVVRELIRYFTNASVLTEEDLRYLKETGWVGFDPGEAHVNSDGTVISVKETPVPEGEAGADAPDPDVPVLPIRTGKRRKPRPAGDSARKLERWLEARIDKWRRETAVLSRLSPEGLRAIRDLPPDTAGDLVFRSLETMAVSSHALWKALLADAYRNWFDKAGATGPATRAFRALLTESAGSDLAGYRWLWRYGCVAEVALLASVQRTLLRGVDRMLRSDPPRVGDWVRREKSIAGLFVLVLAETMQSFDPETRAMPGGEVPQRSLPRARERRRSIRAVTLMNPGAAIPFLEYSTSLWGAAGVESADDYGDLQLQSPLSWRLGSGAWRAPEAGPPEGGPSVRVMLDASIDENDERELFQAAGAIRGVAHRLGILEMCFLRDNGGSRSYFLVQIAKFANPGFRRSFAPALMQILLENEAGLTVSAGERPCFFSHVTGVRKEWTI